MYLIVIASVIIFIMTELNELDSVHHNNDNQLQHVHHLIQKFIIEEQTANENVIYCMNIIIGTALICGYMIPTLMLVSNPVNLVVLFLVGTFISIVIMNSVVAFIDRKYDKYWLTVHNDMLKKSFKEK